MEYEKRQLKTFQDLNAWQQCRSVYKKLYEITKKFPEDEKYVHVSQMRRAAVSSASNLAEGFGRSSVSDKRHFYVIARGSITELQNQCILACDVGLMSEKDLEDLQHDLETAHKLVVGLIKVTN